MNNRKWNSKNPHQGKFLRVLCVCSAGLLRSPTVAHVLTSSQGFNTRAVGLEKDFALIPIDDVLLDWADAVVVMDSTQAQRIIDMDFQGDVYNFSIPDNFEYADSELVEIAKQRASTMEDWKYA